MKMPAFVVYKVSVNDQQTDKQTDREIDITSHRDARTHLKRDKKLKEKNIKNKRGI